MPKYYCDYCDTHLTHDSPSVRKTHSEGRKHRDNVRLYYQKWMEEEAQHLIDVTTAAYKSKNKFVLRTPYDPNMNITAIHVPPPGYSLLGIPGVPPPSSSFSSNSSSSSSLPSSSSSSSSLPSSSSSSSSFPSSSSSSSQIPVAEIPVAAFNFQVCYPPPPPPPPPPVQQSNVIDNNNNNQGNAAIFVLPAGMQPSIVPMMVPPPVFDANGCYKFQNPPPQ